MNSSDVDLFREEPSTSSSDDESVFLEALNHDSQVANAEISLMNTASSSGNTDNMTSQLRGNSSLHSSSYSRIETIAKLESVFDKLVRSLSNNTELCLSLTERSGDDQNNADPVTSRGKQRAARFPGNTPREAWKFTTLLRVLEIMYESLLKDVVVSKRDIYYRDPALFAKQAVVDRLVDDVAAAFQMSRSSLNVVAAAKGIISGQVRITSLDRTILDGSSDFEGLLIPHLKRDDVVDTLNAKWILVIEKEAVFRGLLSSEHGEALLRHGILITGKGYPDIATRALLRRLASPLPQDRGNTIPILGLADYDPDGVAILSTYKNGSSALRHENNLLVVPSLRWFGLRIEDIMTLPSSSRQRQGLLTLTLRDRQKASGMLEWGELDEQDSECGRSWKRQLQLMLMLNVKAEIEVLENFDGGVGQWVLGKLSAILLEYAAS